MKAILNRLTHHETLESSEAEKILIGIAEGQYNNSQISAFLTVELILENAQMAISGIYQMEDDGIISEANNAGKRHVLKKQ